MKKLMNKIMKKMTWMVMKFKAPEMDNPKKFLAKDNKITQKKLTMLMKCKMKVTL